MLYKMDNTTFGGSVPRIPIWTGPGQTNIIVQAMLYASLAAALLSAFLAMLGKQWLNRYASIDMRGTAIERSQNRQRKLDGLVTWYFDHVMEALPVMLQIALLLLGSALSKYLWDINKIVASVVLSVTSFGFLFYILIVIAGAASSSCPYQTPTTKIFRYSFDLAHSFITLVPDILRSTHSFVAARSWVYAAFVNLWTISRLRYHEALTTVLLFPLVLLIAISFDSYRLGRAAFRSLVRFSKSLVVHRSPADPATAEDLRCISWMLQTSLDKSIKVSTFNFLGTILPLPGFDHMTNSTVVVDCLTVFNSCFATATNTIALVTLGSERLAGISAMCLIRAFSSLLSTEPASAVIVDVFHRYKRGFPYGIGSQGLTSSIITCAVQHLLSGLPGEDKVDWRRYHPPSDELIPLSRALLQVALYKDYRFGTLWLIRFAFRFLSQDPLPPSAVVIDCLTIVANEMRCNISGLGGTKSDNEYVYTSTRLSLR